MLSVKSAGNSSRDHQEQRTRLPARNASQDVFLQDLVHNQQNHYHTERYNAKMQLHAFARTERVIVIHLEILGMSRISTRFLCTTNRTTTTQKDTTPRCICKDRASSCYSSRASWHVTYFYKILVHDQQNHNQTDRYNAKMHFKDRASYCYSSRDYGLSPRPKKLGK